MYLSINIISSLEYSFMWFHGIILDIVSTEWKWEMRGIYGRRWWGLWSCRMWVKKGSWEVDAWQALPICSGGCVEKPKKDVVFSLHWHLHARSTKWYGGGNVVESYPTTPHSPHSPLIIIIFSIILFRLRFLPFTFPQFFSFLFSHFYFHLAQPNSSTYKLH